MILAASERKLSENEANTNMTLKRNKTKSKSASSFFKRKNENLS